MNFLPGSPLTIIKFLERNFDGIPLKKENRDHFLNVDSRKAKFIHNNYRAYLAGNDDFLIPNLNTSGGIRPLIYSPFASMGQYGGDYFKGKGESGRNDQEIFGLRHKKLRTMLLLYDSVVITDQLDSIFSFWDSDKKTGWSTKEISERYEYYIDFLISIKPLIDQGIVIISSERRANEVVPYWNSSKVEEKCPLSSFPMLRTVEGEDYRRTYLYLCLANQLKSHPFFDNNQAERKYKSLMSIKWMRDWAPKFNSASGTLKDISLKIPDEDVINIRLSDDVFAQWRETLSHCLQTSDAKEFKETIEDGLKSLSEKRRSFLDGVPTKYVFGILEVITGHFLPMDLTENLAMNVSIQAFTDLFSYNSISATKAAKTHYAALKKLK